MRKFILQTKNWINNKINNATGFIGSVIDNVLTKLLGPEKAAQWNNWNTRQRVRLKDSLSSVFNPSAKYYKPIVILWKSLIFGILLIAFYIFCVETNFLWLMGSMPSVEDLQNPKVAQSSEIYTSDGVMIGKFYTENRTPVTYEELSPFLIDALIATEDVRFYQHSGIDFQAMASVAMSILKGETDRGGGSTITQQLSKKLFKTRRKDARGLLGYIPGMPTLIYKTKEWLTSIKLERNFTKEEILTMYFNTVDYGNNTYGINTATKSYFGKTPDSLTVQEAAVLVGLQKATTTYNPIRNPERSLERRNVVLSQMNKYGYLSQHEIDSLQKLPIDLKVSFETPYDGNANYFKNAVVDFVKEWGEEQGYNLYTDGLKIHTTIDSRLQEYAEEALSEKMRILQKTFDDHWGKNNPWIDDQGKEIEGFLNDVVKRTKRYQTLTAKFPEQPDSVQFYLNKKDTIQVYDWEKGGPKTVFMSPMDSLHYYKRILRAGMMSMNPYSGHIKAWVGGLDYEFFKYDHVKQAKRQPGSTFKPFVYAAAIDDSTFNMSPCDQIQDKPFEIDVEEENGIIKKWRPKNATGVFSYASMSLRLAMAQSINSVTAELTNRIGPETVVKYAKKLGITTPLEPVPSIGLGPFDVSLYDMIAAYSSFVNNGIYTKPQLVTRIEDRNGNLIEEITSETRQAIRPESAFLMVHMLKGGIEEPGGTSRGLWGYDVFRDKNEIGGKTGTSSNNSDGWFMSITSELVTGAWVGGDDRSIHFRTTRLGEGSKTALPIVGRFLEKAYRDKSLALETGPFPKPAFEISKNYICPTYIPEPDSLDLDSDSLYIERREEEEIEIGPPPPPSFPDPIP